MQKAFKSIRLLNPLYSIQQCQNKHFGSALGTHELTQAPSAEEITKLGLDMEYNAEKHHYFSKFPFALSSKKEKQLLKEHRSEISSYWEKWAKNRDIYFDFNILFRELHQWCAIPDHEGLSLLCEPNLSSYLSQTLNTIHQSGYDIEFKNLTVSQPILKMLSLTLRKNLHITRTHNLALSDYTISQDRLLGIGPLVEVYKPLPHTLEAQNYHILDMIREDYKPYHLTVVVLVQSPMSMFLYNQNRSAVLYAGQDGSGEGSGWVSNVVKFEINVKPYEFFRIANVGMKPPLVREWKITDFNGVLDGNPLF